MMVSSRLMNWKCFERLQPRAPDAAQRSCGALLIRGPSCVGPGSAEQREERCTASGTQLQGSNKCHTTGLTPGSAVTRSRNFAPRISKLRYWSNEAQAGDNSTTGSASPEASASRAELATATSSVSLISYVTLPSSVAANSLAASPIR